MLAFGDVQVLLDALAEWQVLDRSYDGTRAANLAEYRNRHYVYQFTQAGYRAYRAVEEVLTASLEDAQLSRLVFPDILADLRRARRGGADRRRRGGVQEAVPAGRGAGRHGAARRPVLPDAGRPGADQRHPARSVPRAQGRAAHPHAGVPLRADPVRPAAGRRRRRGRGHRHRPARRASRGGRRVALPRPRRAGRGLAARAGAAWCSGSAPASTARPSACRTPRSPGSPTSRRCCGGSPSPAAAGSAGRASCATSRNGSPPARPTTTRTRCSRRCSASARRGTSPLGYEDPELIGSRLSWWEAEPVELSRTLVRNGKARRCAGPGRIQRNDEEKQRLRAEQLKATAQRRTAAAAAGWRRRLRPGTGRAGDPGAAQPARRGVVRAGAGQPDGESPVRDRDGPVAAPRRRAPHLRPAAARPCTRSAAGCTWTAWRWRSAG